ncbi:MAG TPA: RNA polymerase sigma factor [Puia sp.]|jgi:RNA polymerase sigma factor (sigma-70 family)|nr:RNA polymerase sigma factor [Puia sp.]
MLTKAENIPQRELQNLIQGCLTKDRTCQKRLYEIYGPTMMSLCLLYSKNREEAEEVLQDGFIQMYKCISQFKNYGSFEGWLRKIMINCALQRYRGKSNRLNMIPLSEEQLHLPSENNQLERLSEKELIRLIQTLPPVYRMVFNLYVFEGMKHREIASMLNITEGTSKSNLSDARSFLKKHLTPKLKIAR